MQRLAPFWYIRSPMTRHPLCCPLLAACLLLGGCSEKKAPAAEPPAQPRPAGPEKARETAATEPGLAAMPEIRPPENPDEACAQIIVVAYRGAQHAGEAVTRDQAAALERARQLLSQAKRQPDLSQLARENSDALASGRRGGVIGSYTRDSWPEIHQAIVPTVFSLRVNETADKPVEAPYGYVIVRRCRVEKARVRHILVRYHGAEGAGPEITRTREQARVLAEVIYAQVTRSGADFAAVARARSEDGSASRGGDLGLRTQGQLAAAFEQAVFAMGPGQIVGPVETEFGFHVIERMKP